MIQPSQRSQKIQLKEGVVKRIRIWVLSRLGFLLLWVWMKSLRWQLYFEDEASDIAEPGSAILAFWHGEQLMMPRIVAVMSRKHKRRICVLISQHEDGRLIAGAVRGFAVDSVAGSSTRGGISALKALHKELKTKNVVAITPDGPKGPKHKVKPGVVSLAQLSGAKIYPLSILYKKSKKLSSWDGFLLPAPFTQAVLGIGTAVTIGRDLSTEEGSLMLEESLERLREKLSLINQ